MPIRNWTVFLLSLTCATGFAADSSPTRNRPKVSLTIDNALSADRVEPVTCGVPLPKGFAASARELVLWREGGGSIPLQARTTATYGDGTPRWVLLDFVAYVPANGSMVYELQRGEPVDPPRPLSWSLTNGQAVVDTGAARFVVDANRYRLFDSVQVLGAGTTTGATDGVELLDSRSPARGLRLESADGTVLTADASPAKAQFEDTGPLRTTLCVRGTIGEQGAPLRAEYVCRMHFYAGSPAVRVLLTLRNPAAHAHPGNLWDLGSGGSLYLEDVSLLLPLAVEGARARVSGFAESDARLKLYQDSSGGENWHSANHVDKDHEIPLRFRGYRVYRGDEAVASGDRIDGWIHARGQRGGVAVALREFWQNFPKALAFEDGALRIGLWPRESAGVHEILGGEQKTHELLFWFHGPSNSDSGGNSLESALRACHRPLYVLPDPESVLSTTAFGPSAPLDRKRFARLEATCDIAVDPRGGSPDTIQTRWEVIDEFGWRHFGDTFADNERAPEAMVKDFPEHHPGGLPISHFVNEYDVIYAVMLQGLRRTDPRWMGLADACARHHADICVNHTDEDSPAYSHGPFMHTTHDTAAYRSTLRSYPIEAKRYNLQYGQGGGPNAGHAYVACLAQHYLLTGNRTSLEAFLEVAEWAAESPWFSPRMMGDQRGYGNLLTTVVYAYQLTAERRYYDRAMTLVGWIDEPFAGLGGNLFVKAAGRFLDMKRDRDELDDDYGEVRALLLRFGEHYLTLPPNTWESFLEQRCFHAEVLCTCFLHAPEGHPKRADFLRMGTGILDEALERFPGRYVPVKTWVMCFANTGAYLKAKERR